MDSDRDCGACNRFWIRSSERYKTGSCIRYWCGKRRWIWTGKIGSGGVKEEVADELLISRVWRAVDGDEIEIGRGLDV